MEYWFTADTHLGHGNIIKHVRRTEFLSAEEKLLLDDPAARKWHVSQESVNRQDEAIIANINAVIKPGDELWILGDFCWGGFEAAKAYLSRIACKNVNLVYGNHDKREIGRLFRRAWDQGMIDADGQPIWVNHYPMRSWDRSFHGSWHLYGHVHGRMKHQDDADPCVLTMDVGVDPLGFKPISLTRLREHFAPKIENFLKRKEAFASGKGEVSWA